MWSREPEKETTELGHHSSSDARENEKTMSTFVDPRGYQITINRATLVVFKKKKIPPKKNRFGK